MPNGFVSLVGAGPGDPGLLTQRAIERLAEADLVLYDALVSPSILELATRSQRFSVGKRAGRKSVRQESINALMVTAARRGKRVVRLKSGDPFVLGRGGEEVIALREAGVPFEVIPGITSAVAAPALAGIPVTHRGLSSGFLVLSGHAESAYAPVLAALPPGSVTVVILMGLGRRREIATLLTNRGWAPTTPVAILKGASTPEAFTWIGTLASMPAAPVEEDSDAPGTIVIGEVVSLAHEQSATRPDEAERIYEVV